MGELIYEYYFFLPIFSEWYFSILSPPFGPEISLFILQAVGIIAAVGDSVKNLKVGSPAALMTFGSYAEFTMVHYL